jgi:hypothetical protein
MELTPRGASEVSGILILRELEAESPAHRSASAATSDNRGGREWQKVKRLVEVPLGRPSLGGPRFKSALVYPQLRDL